MNTSFVTLVVTIGGQRYSGAQDHWQQYAPSALSAP
uniref:Cauli_VI domain-containing protein n=1 Tax=Heterorhabditis bacteriophora TaxID=37862 RepID=A0A1I7W622_HETBA